MLQGCVCKRSLNSRHQVEQLSDVSLLLMEEGDYGSMPSIRSSNGSIKAALKMTVKKHFPSTAPASVSTVVFVKMASFSWFHLF